jgi:hypothetical protein
LTPPEHPLVFTKLPDSLAGPLEDVTIDTETTELDYEVGSPSLLCPTLFQFYIQLIEIYYLTRASYAS